MDDTEETSFQRRETISGEKQATSEVWGPPYCEHCNIAFGSAETAVKVGSSLYHQHCHTKKLLSINQ